MLISVGNNKISTRCKVDTYDGVTSPCFIYDVGTIKDQLQTLRDSVNLASTQILYSLKACSMGIVLDALRESIDGFAVSSPAEALIASQYMGDSGSLHITTPGFVDNWISEIPRLTHVTFNSLSQYERMQQKVRGTASIGIRLNTGVSIVDDERYNPNRKYSKLGVSIVDAKQFLSTSMASSVKGLHFHNACLSTSWQPLLDMVKHVESHLSPILSRIEWINLGGGYIWNETTSFEPLQEAIDIVANKYGLRVFVEPGAGIVNSAACLVASVIDVITSDGKMIAVLDTTVNHLPEVFEYQYEPDIDEHVENGPFEYILAGSSCLAGDIFGEYTFQQPLDIGSRITFVDVGAYSLVKAHMFNGINLPTIYTLTESGELVLTKQFTYEDFASRCGVDTNAAIRV